MLADSTHLQIVAFINFVTDAVEPHNLVEIKTVKTKIKIFYSVSRDLPIFGDRLCQHVVKFY